MEISQREENDPESRKRKIFLIIYLLNFIFELFTFIFICILVHLSFKTTLFKNHIIGDLNNYFNNIESSSILNNNTFNENNNITLNNYQERRHYLRNLVSNRFCKEIRDSLIEFKGSKLSDIFDFNLEKIRLFSLISLCVTCPMNLIFIFIFVLVCIHRGEMNKLFDVMFVVMHLSLRLLNVLRFVISLILYHYIETSDLDKYDDFLDCKDVKKKFFEKFSDTDNLRKCFYVYLALDITKQGIEKLNQNFGVDSPGVPADVERAPSTSYST